MSAFKELSKVYYNYALNFLEKNCVFQGIEYLKRSIALNENNIEALNLIGVCEYRNCNFEKSHYFWNKSIQYVKHGNRANQYLKELESKNFKDFISFYNKGIEKVELEKYKESINIFKEVIEINNDFIEPYIILSVAYYNIKKYDSAKEFLEKAMKFDRLNDKYFKIAKEIDSKNINVYKNWIIKKKNIIGVLGTITSLSMVTGTFNCKAMLKQKKEILNYEKNISKIEDVLTNTTKERDVLNSELKNYKMLNSNSNLKNEKKEILIEETNYRDTEEINVFLEAISLFKNEEYKKAINAFVYISEKGEQTTLVGESIFFAALCAEKLDDVKVATKYYEKYITNFKHCNYYDDSLYNYGLMSYQLGNIEKSKKILNKLCNEVPSSIFLNSKVKYILK